VDHFRHSVAIIIPCRNEEQHIARCLESLLANDYSRELLEIVVVDGMSDDRTRDIVRHYSSQYPFISLLDNPQRGKSAALNLGIAATDSDVVMRIDAHATYAANYISKLVGGLFEHQADNIGGVRKTDTGKTRWSQAVGLVISHPFAAGNALYRTGARGQQIREVDTVFCGCYRREVFRRIGGFHPELARTQDREFNARLAAASGKILLDPSAECCYYPRSNLGDYVRWVWQGAFWVFYADRFTTTKLRSWRNWVPALFVLWHVVVGVLALAAPLLAAMAALPLAAYWLSAASCSLTEAARHRFWRLLPSLMLLFPLTHYTYGFGSLAGRIACLLRGNRRSSPPRFPQRSTFRRSA
jgi:glycosyltransferase involved in cell wall biosynthesis